MQSTRQNTIDSLNPFGMPMPLRSYISESYRYGFNGMENANDIAPGNYTTEFRELDTRLGGRWWSTDPIVKPWESPYAGFSNNPIYFADPSGLDPEDSNGGGNSGGDGGGDGGVYDNTPRNPNGKGSDYGKDGNGGYKGKLPTCPVCDPIPKPNTPSLPSNKSTQNISVPKKNWFQKEVETLEIGGDYAMKNSILFRWVSSFNPNIKQKDKEDGLNIQMGDSNGAMSSYEAGSITTPNEVDIELLLSVINLLPKSSLKGFLGDLPKYITLTGEAGSTVIKIATDKSIETQTKTLQDATMKKKIEIIQIDSCTICKKKGAHSEMLKDGYHGNLVPTNYKSISDDKN